MFNIFTDIGSGLYNVLHPTETMLIGTGQLSQRQVEMLANLEPSYVPLSSVTSADDFINPVTGVFKSLLPYVGVGIIAYMIAPLIIASVAKEFRN